MNKNILIYIISDININSIQIYNSKNLLIIEKNIYNYFYFNGNINEVYKIKIISNNNTYIRSFIILEKYNNVYIFNIKNNNHTKIFIKLLDKNYPNLKIMKGEIKLWENLII